MTQVGESPSVLVPRPGPLDCGHEQRRSLNESKYRGWGGGVAGDRRVGSVDEINRETRRDQKGVHGQKTRRAAWRESERP
jgi:hypothetical protein